MVVLLPKAENMRGEMEKAGRLWTKLGSEGVKKSLLLTLDVAKAGGALTCA